MTLMATTLLNVRTVAMNIAASLQAVLSRAIDGTAARNVSTLSQPRSGRPPLNQSSLAQHQLSSAIGGSIGVMSQTAISNPYNQALGVGAAAAMGGLNQGQALGSAGGQGQVHQWVSTSTATTSASSTIYFRSAGTGQAIGVANVAVSAPTINPAQRLLEASDLMEEFAAYLASLGLTQPEMMKLPIGAFLAWLVIHSAELEGIDAKTEDQRALQEFLPPLLPAPEVKEAA